MKVAVVGLGAMGVRLARRLHAEGQVVTVWNRDPSKAAEFASEGVMLAPTPRLAAQESEAVITMVADDRALREITEGSDGVCAGLTPGSCVMQMSTVSHGALFRLSGALPPGTEMLDAPVLGSVAEAEAGTLTIFVGGTAALLERTTPSLEAMGRPMFIGNLGSGTSAKLVANSTLFGCLAVLGESIGLARGLGLSVDRAFEVLSTTPLAAQADQRRPAMDARAFPPRFPLRLARKDSQLVAAAVEEAALTARLIPAVRDWLVAAENQGWGDADYTALLAHITEQSTERGLA